MQRCQARDKSSGIYHAAVIAALAGPDGHVVKINITTATRAYLDRAGQQHVHAAHGNRNLGNMPAPAAHR